MQAIDHSILFTKSDCYKAARKMTPKGIVVHSTGANNPNLWRYVQPDNGDIGVNRYGTDLNRPGQDVCVHAFIGKDKNGVVKCVKTLPFDICCWGVGSGSKGSYNYDPAYIQFEICEDGLNDKAYCKACYDKAVELCTAICKEYKIPVSNIVSHYEAGLMGYGSQHVDPKHWWDKYGLTIESFRKAVQAKLTEKPVLDKTGYRKGDNTIGSFAVKEWLILAKQVGISTKGMDENRIIGDGTVNAINYLLGKWGYQQNGIAGENFIKRIVAEVRKKVLT